MKQVSPDSSPNDGALFMVESWVPNGSTEPGSYQSEPTFTAITDESPLSGETIAPAFELSDTDVPQSIRRAVDRANHRTAQLGKHSAMVPGTDRYDVANIRPGTFLPGLGPVTVDNIAIARLRAAAHNRAQDTT